MTAKFSNYFKIVTPKPGVTTMTDNQNIGDQGAYANYTWYQRLVQGAASRITRYREYDLMDNDIEIARALDTIAEEMVGSDPNDDMPIELTIHKEKVENIPSRVVLTLKTALRYWSEMHSFGTRLYNIARTLVKYGDCFFIRNENNLKWEYIHPKNVVAAIVDERDMTQVLGWQVRRDTKTPNSPYNNQSGGMGVSANQDSLDVIPADKIIWFSMGDDMSDAAPFGESVLRAIYRAQKQKELLEDSIIIYRIQRAPERRVFYIDVGKMPPQRVKTYLEQIKNEIRQKKIPSFGGGTDQVDSVYNPHSMSEDFFFAQRPDGKGSKVETLPGGQGLGELADLEYFQWKVFRGLRIPLSYMREGSDGGMTNDGKTGIAYIQELRFAMFIKRLQGYLASVLDKEFKRYLRTAGISVDPSLYKLTLPEPENFGIYRQQQLDSDLLTTASTANGIEYLSKQFVLSKYLQLTEEEITLNARQLAQEKGLDPDNLSKDDLKTLYTSDAGGLGGGLDIGGGGMIAGGPMGGPLGDIGEGEPGTAETAQPAPTPVAGGTSPI